MSAIEVRRGWDDGVMGRFLSGRFTLLAVSMLLGEESAGGCSQGRRETEETAGYRACQSARRPAPEAP